MPGTWRCVKVLLFGGKTAGAIENPFDCVQEIFHTIFLIL
jgi:hypothetical protein